MASLRIGLWMSALCALGLGTASCLYTPDLGPAPFLCDSSGRCPSGYTCTVTQSPPVCVRNGELMPSDGGIMTPDLPVGIDILLPDTPLPDTPAPDLPVNDASPDLPLPDSGGEDIAIRLDLNLDQGNDASTCSTLECQACAQVEELPEPPADPDGVQLTRNGTTSGSGIHEGSCPNPDFEHTPFGPEKIYRVNVPFPARLEIDTQGTSFDTVLYVRSNCEDGPDLSCNDDINTAGQVFQSRVSVTVQPGTYYIFVDGYDQKSSGAYTLTFSVFAL